MRRQSGNVELGLIFDYDSCNDYAKLIIDKSNLKIVSDSTIRDAWLEWRIKH